MSYEFCFTQPSKGFEPFEGYYAGFFSSTDEYYQLSIYAY